MCRRTQRVSNYYQYRKRLDFTGIDFPVTVGSIDMFEELNPGISINVYTWEGELRSLRISKHSPTIGDPDKKHVDLLLYCGHYILIRTMSRLLFQIVKGRLIYLCYK